MSLNCRKLEHRITTQYQLLMYHRESSRTFEKGVIEKLFHRKTCPDGFHWTVLESIIVHISDFFKYNSCIGVDFTRFPYQEERVNEWFQVVKEDDQEGKTISVINIDHIKGSEKVYSPQYRTEFPKGLLDADHKILFHGTNHHGAQSISEEGILLSKGAKNQDFSSGKGFYLSSSIEEALQWACHRFDRPAVVVYKIQLETLANYNGFDLQGEENKQQWKEIVIQCRKSQNQDKKFLRRIRKQYNYIEGPMASISKNRQEMSRPPRQKENSYQFCILSEELAEDFYTSLHSLLFFAK